MATIKEVSDLAGVSTATVSRVINKTGNVKAATRKKVNNAIKKLNFSPNVSARTLQTKKTETIGMVFPDASSFYFSEIIRGIIANINKYGFQILIGSAHDEEEEFRTASRFLSGRTVDGLVLMAPSIKNEELFALPLSHDTPVVFMSVPSIKSGMKTVVLDNYKNAKKLTQRLIKMGHENIGFIHGPSHNYDSKERYNGYLNALKSNGISISDKLEAQGNFTEDSGYKACQSLLRVEPWPTAIFAANDAMAIGAIEAVKDDGKKVPEDIAIVGFDDISMAKYISPALTTVKVPLFEMGQIVGKTLIQKINCEDDNNIKVDEKIVIPLELKIRESCGSH